MSFWQGFSSKVKNIAQNVAKKSGDMVEVTKINLSISTEEENIKKLYTEIGKYCYEIYEKNVRFDNTINELCEKIKAHKNAIESLNEKINELKNVVKCQACGNVLPRDSVYCAKCGVKIEIKEAQIETETEKNSMIIEANQEVQNRNSSL